MKDKEAVRMLFPDAEVVPSEGDPAYAIAVRGRRSIIAKGVSEADAWKQAAVTLRWEARLRKKGDAAAACPATSGTPVQASGAPSDSPARK